MAREPGARKSPSVSEVRQVTYLLTLAKPRFNKNGNPIPDGEPLYRRITVPSTWRLTLGPLVPGTSKGSFTNTGCLCLRVYESKDLQRAVFTDVQSFRDMSLKVEELVDGTIGGAS